jgi:hypothetical protein
LQTEIAALRAEIASLDSTKFTALPQLNKGAEAKVHHDEEGKVVYKLFRVRTAKPALSCPVKCGWAETGKFALRPVRLLPSRNSSGVWHAQTRQGI